MNKKSAPTQHLRFLKGNNMSKVIMVFPIATSIPMIEQSITQAVIHHYDEIIIKFVPKNDVNLYVYNKDVPLFYKDALKKYNLVYSFIKLNYPQQKILFNMEVCYTTLSSYLILSQHYKLPIFIDYFYNDFDLISVNELKDVKRYCERMDFNHIFVEENKLIFKTALLSKKHLLKNDISNFNMLDNHILKLFDNYDLYYIDSSYLTYFLEWQHTSSKNNLYVEQDEQNSFNQVLLQFHSATPIFYYDLEFNHFKLYLYGFNRFHFINVVENKIIKDTDFLKKTVLYLNKKMNKDSVCIDCSYQKQCFIDGYWLDHKTINTTKECSIYPHYLLPIENT